MTCAYYFVFKAARRSSKGLIQLVVLARRRVIHVLLQHCFMIWSSAGKAGLFYRYRYRGYKR